jgi:hypothetical protein
VLPGFLEFEERGFGEGLRAGLGAPRAGA